MDHMDPLHGHRDLQTLCHHRDLLWILFLLGYAEDMVYAKHVCDACDILHRNIEAINSVTPNMLGNTGTKIVISTGILRPMNGALTEVQT
ncbi:hypothetical protein CDAR_385201 [Caerostris darwini]|uniref:Uncharacterized protein n=1 Tax=Caerostris darwini TaxID=1538125 RepID=A0AAV4RF01_9ARAC|nr:hypothetical protein CDAR_385201 [Caerostris darwini]